MYVHQFDRSTNPIQIPQGQVRLPGDRDGRRGARPARGLPGAALRVADAVSPNNNQEARRSMHAHVLIDPIAIKPIRWRSASIGRLVKTRRRDLITTPNQPNTILHTSRSNHRKNQFSQIQCNSIHGKLPTLNSELMERLRQALLLFMPRVNMKGPVPFLAKPVPTRCVVCIYVYICEACKPSGPMDGPSVSSNRSNHIITTQTTGRPPSPSPSGAGCSRTAPLSVRRSTAP